MYRKEARLLLSLKFSSSLMRAAIKKFFVQLGIIHAYRRLKSCLVSFGPQVLSHNLAYRFHGAIDGFPLPPSYLIYLTINNPSILDYFRGGYITSRSMKRCLENNAIDLKGFKTILEFGVGCGRVLREFPAMTTSELYGSDYNPKLISWCQRNLFCASFSLNQLEPPISYKDNQFDFIYLISVFTHLPEKIQHLWLKEFHRILSYNGYLLITLHGEHLRSQLTSKELALFEQHGYVERTIDSPGSNHYGTFHSRAYFERMIHGMFSLIDFSPGGGPNHPYQDLYLLKRIQEHSQAPLRDSIFQPKTFR